MKEKIPKRIISTIIMILSPVVGIILVAAIVAVMIITPGKIIKDIKSRVSGEDVIVEKVDIVGKVDIEANLNIEYKVGDSVKVENEWFYVIRNCFKDDEKILLLARHNVDTIDLVQSKNANTIAFSEKNYWSKISNSYPYDIIETEEPPESHYAAKVAYDYGKILGAEGRLLTYSEAKILKERYKGDLSGRNYWLSTADSQKSEIFMGCYSASNFGICSYYFDDVCGVRPVIEIDKSKISRV